MKKDRNCMNNNMGVPVYQGINPMMMPQPYPNTMYPNFQGNYNNIDQLMVMQQQINSLEERVTKLEGKNNNYSNKYGDSNYYML